MFVDPVLDGLRRAAKLSSNLGDGAVVSNNLFDGVTLNGKIIARWLFRHRWSEMKISWKKKSQDSYRHQSGITEYAVCGTDTDCRIENAAHYDSQTKSGNNAGRGTLTIR